MSLDVYLLGDEVEVECECPNCQNKHTRKTREQFFQANITHNLNSMASEAGIYKCCWRPDEIGIKKAKQLIEPLQKGLDAMKSDPERFKKHNSKNGWGLYENFVPWIEGYLEACKAHPEANIEVSR